MTNTPTHGNIEIFDSLREADSDSCVLIKSIINLRY